MTYRDPREALTPVERDTLEQIRQRVIAAVPEIVYQLVFGTVDALLAAVHHNQCPLDFDWLLHASDGEFWHDIGGIMRDADFATGTFRLPFTPRCARELH